MALGSAFGDADMPGFFTDFGAQVVFKTVGLNPQGSPILAIMNFETAQHDFKSERSEIVATTIQALVNVLDFATVGMPKRNDPITIGGVNYIVSMVLPQIDGRTAHINLRTA